MTDQQDPREKQYERVRHAFEELEIEDRTLFLIRETINTIAAGVDNAARTLARELETVFRPPQPEHGEEPEGTAPEPAGKAQTKKKAAGTRSTGKAKKTTAKKTTTKKSTSKKSSAKKAEEGGDET